MRTRLRRKPWRGMLAGAVGGIVASAVMGLLYSGVQKALPDSGQSAPQAEDPTVKTASAISHGVFHHELTPEQKKIAGPVVHYAFGTSIAAAYGTAAEFAPGVCVGWGIPFGAAVWLGAHVITVPALGMAPPVTDSDPRKEGTEFAAHLVYGAVVEGLRRLLRTRLLRS